MKEQGRPRTRGRKDGRTVGGTAVTVGQSDCNAAPPRRSERSSPSDSQTIGPFLRLAHGALRFALWRLEAISLPVELRAQLVDALLRSLNPAQAEIDELWAAEAERRIAEIDAGQVQLIPGEEVFAKLRKSMRDAAT